ncbi:uncharacterized protein DDB_G0271670 [Tetranychus urticae]|uniref:Uncharacterized protein n=1 Tax=Tetranychus urticae TaxID=32264 RepID=T1KL62_TETUR|nr:uncharacterized protein DDB_G0271670 [Tetranychus urticae]
MKAWTSEKDGSKSTINKAEDDETSNDLDEALNELGMLSSLTQTRREKWLRRRCYRFSSGNGKNSADSSHWCSLSSSSTSSSSCSGSSQSSGSLGGSIGSRKNSYSSASNASSGSSTSSSSSPYSSLSFSQSSRLSINSHPSFEASASSGFQSNCCISSSSIYASLDLVGDSSNFSNHKLMEYPRVARRHHFHNQCYKPYIRPRRCSLQFNLQKEEPLDLNWNLLKGLSLSDSGSSGTGSGTGTPPPPFFASSLIQSSSSSSSPSSAITGTANPAESKLLCSRITSSIADKENNALETRSNPNSPMRNRNINQLLNYTHAHTLPLKSNQHHHCSTTHQLASSTINNQQNQHAYHYHTEMNPLATSANSVYGSLASTQADGPVALPGSCSNCGKPSEQGSLFRSRSLDDLNSLILQEDVHLNHSHSPYCPPDEGLFNQPMFSSASCDIENVLQKISRLEM